MSGEGGDAGIETTSLADEIAFRLQQAIIARELPPGTKPRQESLCERFGVSRTPIREALRKLQALRLVIMVPNRGATVRLPTRTEIASQMDAAANAMVAAVTPVDENAGLLQNLLSSAESLVKVRPIGAVEGAGAPETVARIEVAVNQGDYAKALSEYDTLPQAAKAAGADFAGKLKARIEVETQVDALISGAMKA